MDLRYKILTACKPSFLFVNSVDHRLLDNFWRIHTSYVFLHCIFDYPCWLWMYKLAVLFVLGWQKENVIYFPSSRMWMLIKLSASECNPHVDEWISLCRIIQMSWTRFESKYLYKVLSPTHSHRQSGTVVQIAAICSLSLYIVYNMYDTQVVCLTHFVW